MRRRVYVMYYNNMLMRGCFGPRIYGPRKIIQASSCLPRGRVLACTVYIWCTRIRYFILYVLPACIYIYIYEYACHMCAQYFTGPPAAQDAGAWHYPVAGSLQIEELSLQLHRKYKAVIGSGCIAGVLRRHCTRTISPSLERWMP